MNLPSEPCPAVKELTQVLGATIPFLAGTYNENVKNKTTGKWEKKPFGRLQWRKDGTANRHDAGLALDVILFANVETERILGEHLCAAFRRYQYLMGWLGMIFMNVNVNGETGGSNLYTDDEKHYTHIHIDWFKDAVRNNAGEVTDIPWPPTALTTGFADLMREFLTDLGDSWSKGELQRIGYEMKK
jgi:hypothetical protein